MYSISYWNLLELKNVQVELNITCLGNSPLRVLIPYNKSIFFFNHQTRIVGD